MTAEATLRDFWREMRPSLTLGLGAYGAYAIRPHDDGGWGWYQIGDPEADHGECDRQGRSATIDGCVSAILGRQEDATCAEPTVGEVAACVAALDERMDRYDPSKNTRIHDRFTDLDVRLARLEEWRKGRDQ